MIKAVIFDYDGVIVNNLVAHVKTWKVLFARYGIKITKHDLDHVARGRPTKEILRFFLKDKFDDQKLDEVAIERLEIYKSIPESQVEPQPGLISLLKEIKKRRILLAIATSSLKSVLAYKMRNHNLGKYFDVIMTSDNISKGKPHPEIYLKTASKLGVKPGECVVFEDSFAGVKAAKSAGMKVILVMTSHK